MSGGQEPVGAGRGLILEERGVDDVWNLAERVEERQIARGRIERIPGGDDERVDLAAIDLVDQLAQAGGARARFVQERRVRDDGLAQVAESLVDGERERVHRGRLPLAGDD